MSAEYGSVPLASLGVLRARGADAVSFLQGQLSNDLSLLAPERSLLAGYHNPQGRVIALLRLVELTPTDVLAILPRELVGTLLQRLAKFILRSKVALTDDSALWRISGLIAPDAARAGGLGTAMPEAVHAVARIDGAIAVRVAHEPRRWLFIGAADQPALLQGASSAAPAAWQRLAVAGGEPQVYASTCEEFVAQMLNLDLIGAIAFSKGCYTGQEVIARTHYRGRVKRRLQRFRTDSPVPLKAGDSGVLADGRSFTVIEAAALEEGGCEFLAVAALASEAAAPPGSSIRAQQLELPYPLPA
jgi:tRNA-modifying protein YgfZ